ncbi:hypothetical protein [Chryseobacterium chendengshani]|uniref:hypothetical protein n=1 Tax=unclassified Chryseobacterium TaxID=2593645 RepID=UPI001C63D1AF|nr:MULTISPECIES: hypothetical protein [unclassified Chryseobacterium]MBW7675586.1 hypothetical protein [Chryseobacterium sp. LJ756]MBW8521851.1 hypothetical protein [Chryseobacterium sp. LJ668]QYK17510.1 hypothetical protein K0U91_05140 [Chryseobacterium sp. LJ668]
MKRLFYFILLVAGIASVHSCKDLTDEEGNPLIDLNESSGFNGPRALFREITDSDTIAEYQYNGLLLTKVITDKYSVANVMWSGDKISQIDFKGHLDNDGDGDLDEDSIVYTQLFTYGNLGRLTIISENRSTFKRGLPIPPSTTPGPYALNSKVKILYDLNYSSTTGKLDIINMKSGADVIGVPFVYQDYSKSWYTYLGDNVSKVERHYGKINAGVNGPATERYAFEFLNYDSQINPYTLLPFAFKVSTVLAVKNGDKKSFVFSPNNPKRIAITDLVPPIPTPVIFSTSYRYDAQTYMTQGFAVNYIYKPM